MKATLSPDGKFVTLDGNVWGERFLIEELPARIKLYRGLVQRGGKNGAPGPWADYYQPTLEGLLQVQREARQRGGQG